MSETIERLMDAAEIRIRSQGYHAMSFRDLADDLGIKSSSVHYHFRRKEDLAVALVQRYSDNFFHNLKQLSSPQLAGKSSIEPICALYRSAFSQNGHICLCGILGAEKDGLPLEVNEAVAVFLTANVDWVKAVLPKRMTEKQKQMRAEHVIATLQGALILTKNLSGIDVFDRIVKHLSATIKD